MPIANIFRAGKVVRTTSLTSAQTEQFQKLAAAVHAAGHMVRDEPGQNIFTILARLDELLDQTETPADRQRVAYPVVPDPIPPKAVELRKTFPAGDWRAQAESLGMVPLDGLEFDRAELTDPPPAGVVSSGVVVAGGGAPQIRAWVRWTP